MTIEEYMALDAVNWSTLKAMDESPAHYLAAVKEGRPDTDALKFGRLVDVLIFTPEAFASSFIVSPYDKFQSNESKAWRSTMEASGLEVVKADTVADAQRMADAVHAHPIARRYLRAGEFQTPMVWTDPDTGLRCKGRTDLLSKGRRFLIDGKSAKTIDKRRYLSQAGSLRYHCQLAHYRNGCRLALGFEPEFIGHIVYEKGAPYDVGVFEFAPAVIDAGEVIVKELLARVAECRESGVWPGRYPEIESVTMDDMPRWLDMEDDESAEDLGITSTF